MVAENKITRLDTPPIFIIGVGRSGTSLLQSMLHAHSQVTFLPETHFFRNYIAYPGIRQQMEAMLWSDLQKKLEKDEDLKRAGVSVNALVEASHHDNPDMVKLYDRLLSTYLDREGGRIVGDKDPRNIDHLQAIHRIYPAAKVLHIIRDPRDVLLSRMKAAWSAHRPYWMHLFIYSAQFGKGRRLGQSLFGPAYLEVQYEQLIQQPEQVLTQICKHIGVDFEPGMLTFGNAAKKLVDDSEMQWKKEVLGPLMSKNMAKWKSGLTPWQIRLTEKLCREPFVDFDYSEADLDQDVKMMQRLMLGMAPLAGKVFSLAYEWGRKYQDQ